MIELKLREDTSFKRLENGSFFNAKISKEIDLPGFAFAARESIEQHLHAAYGEKAKHFTVTTIGTNQFIVNVKVVTDDIGAMWMAGTPEHEESAHGGAMKFVASDGETIYRSGVDHKGYKGIAPEVKKIIDQAILAAFIYLR